MLPSPLPGVSFTSVLMMGLVADDSPGEGASALLSQEGRGGKFLGRKRRYEEGHVFQFSSARKASPGTFASDTSSHGSGRYDL